MQTGDFVKIINHEDHPLEWQYASQRYILPVGDEGTMVPYQLAVLHLGDPASTERQQAYKNDQGESVFPPTRTNEIKRLRTLYDNHVCVEGRCNHHPGFPEIGDETKVFKVPRVSVFDLKGEKVKMLIDDP